MNTKELPWITFDQLISIAVSKFRTPYEKANRSDAPKSIDPTLPIVRSYLTSTRLEEYPLTDQVVATTKTMQNAIGDFHQAVLGSVAGWSNMGTNAGVLDIKSTEPIPLANNRMVLAEVKMRFNTIKASDEKNTHDKTERCHPSETRPLNVREYARIQTFPDEWQFAGGITGQCKRGWVLARFE